MAYCYKLAVRKRHISILSTRNVLRRWGVGGGVGACDVFQRKIVENFDSLIKIFNILKSSIQSIQNPAFSYVYLHFKSICMLMALLQVYLYIFIDNTQS